MIKIEKGVPIPKTRGNSELYLFRQLEVGDSYIIPQDKVQETRTQASKWKAQNPGWNFVTRKQSDGRVRIWRTA